MECNLSEILFVNTKMWLNLAQISCQTPTERRFQYVLKQHWIQWLTANGETREKQLLAACKSPHLRMSKDQPEATICLGAAKWIGMVVKALAVVPKLGRIILKSKNPKKWQ